MPRGDPEFGRNVKSPGRPPQFEKLSDARVYREDTLKERLPEILDVMLDDAVRRKNPKTAQALIEMLFGKPVEQRTPTNDALHIFLHGLAKAVRGEITEGDFKELGPGPEVDPGGETD